MFISFTPVGGILRNRCYTPASMGSDGLCRSSRKVFSVARSASVCSHIRFFPIRPTRTGAARKRFHIRSRAACFVQLVGCCRLTALTCFSPESYEPPGDIFSHRVNRRKVRSLRPAHRGVPETPRRRMTSGRRLLDSRVSKAAAGQCSKHASLTKKRRQR